MCKAGASPRALVTPGDHHPTLMCYQQLTKVTRVLAGLRSGAGKEPGLHSRAVGAGPGFRLRRAKAVFTT